MSRLRGGVFIALARRLSPTSDRGAALITTMIFMIMLGGLSLLLLGIILGQLGPARLAQKQTETGYASQAGLQAALNAIRSIDQNTVAGVFGDRSKLPCEFEGNLDGTTSSELSYHVTIEYFTADPTYENADWRATTSHRVPCLGSGLGSRGVASQPTHALIMSRGLGPDVAGFAAGDGDRGVAAVYAFKLTNVNIAGGLMLTAATGGYCLRARPTAPSSTPAPGDAVVFIPVANCTVQETDNWIYNANVQFELASARDNGYPTGLCITQGPTLIGTDYQAKVQLCKAKTDPTRWDQVFSADGGTVLHRQAYNDPLPGTIRDARSSWCLSPTSSVGTNNPVLIRNGAGCDNWANESKVGPGAASKATNQIVNYAEFGRCMDVTEGAIGKEFMIVWPCKQDAVGGGLLLNWNHKFYYDEPPGLTGSINTVIRVKVNNNDSATYCLQAPTTGIYVTFQGCTGGANQQWTRYAAMPGGWVASWMFINPATGQCIGTRAGEYNGWVSKMALLDCTGLPDQKWNAPPYSSEATVGGFKEIPG